MGKAGDSRVDYDAVAQGYDRVRGWGEEVPRRMWELASEIRGGRPLERVLEFGCGTGNATRYFERYLPAGERSRIVGLDSSARMLAEARAKLSRAELVRGDARELPFADGEFEAVLAVYVIHNVPGTDRPRALAEAARVLRSGGALVLATSSHAQISSHPLGKFFPRLPELDRARFPDIPELLAMMESAGFRELATESVIIARPAVDEAYLAKVRGKHISTFELMEEAEFAGGLMRFAAAVAEAARTGARVEHVQEGTLVKAVRG